MELLKLGLDRLGIGAKTNAGYGRMDLAWESFEERGSRQEKALLDAQPLPERLPKLHAERLKQPLGEQADWLMTQGKQPQHGASEAEWKRALRAAYADAIAYLRRAATGEVPELEDARQKLRSLEDEKPDKKDKKAFRRWQKNRDKLDKEIAKREKETENRQERRAGIEAWLAWLDAEE